jgi:hypothetical protein
LKELATYTGDTFRNLIRQYSYDRMSRDSKYRRDVFKAIEERKTKQAAAKAQAGAPKG